MLWHAYVDETGDRGWTRRAPETPIGTRAGSSEHFSMGAIIVPDGYQTAVLDRWDEVALEIGRNPGDVIHWINIRSHAQRLYLAQTVAGFDQAFVAAVVFSKWDTPNVNANGVQQPEYLYNWLLRMIVERLSWFARDRGDTIKLTFGQVRGLDPRKLHDYLTRLRGLDTTIAWEALHLPPRIDTPANRRMLQVADTVCGTLSSAFEWDNFGNVETRYLEALRPRLWIRNGNLSSYGLKVNPCPHPRHGWLTEFCARR
ncbi:MAG: DUF3800 domain-containing protein [Actinomycetota bacterium]|nr:DUF3800 domain-containing protein [Actinomycetota bacterium]